MGIDVGVGSLGVAILDMESNCIVDGVSLIYSTAKTKADRRKFRGQRNQIQRKSCRLDYLRKYLSEILSVSEDSDRTDKAHNNIGENIKRTVISPNSVVQLRSKGLKEAISNEDLFRVLMHIARNRGLRLNVGKTAEEQKESKSLKGVVSSFSKNIGTDLDFLTVGDKLADIERHGKTIKMRRNIDDELSIFYSRAMVEEELNVFLEKQKTFNPKLTDEVVIALRDNKDKKTGVFWEKPVDINKIADSIGKCCYNIHPQRFDEYTIDVSETIKGKKKHYETRLAVHHPIFQEKRLYEQLNNIRIRFDGTLRNTDGLLTLAERDALYKLASGKEETTASQIKKALKINTPEYTISLESSYSRKKSSKANGIEDRVIKGNSLLLKVNKTRLGEIWVNLDDSEIEQCLALWNENDLDKSEQFFETLLDKNKVEYSDGDIEKICDITLEKGYSSAGITATKWLLDEHKKDVIDNRMAEDNLGLTMRKSATGEEAFKTLPYYGEVLDVYCVGGTYHPKDKSIEQFGEIPNSVVSSSLNKIRKTVNDFIKLYGLPEKINIELSRDMAKSEAERDKIQKDIAINQKKNIGYDKTITEHNKKPLRKYRRAIKLFDWQERKCPYTNETIAMEDIFNGEAVLDHILPREETQDDSLSNLVLCKKKANDDKGKNAPFDAFGGGYDYKGNTIPYKKILENIDNSPELKKKKFNADAMDKFKETNSMLKRYETDTSYLARVAKDYLGCLWSQEHKPIRVLTGGITHELRRNWGVNNIITDITGNSDKKDRSDNRHHLLDAIVIGCADQSAIQKLHTHNKNKYWKDDKIILQPWDNFRNDVTKFISNPALVKHAERVNNKQGELHKQTPYKVLAELLKSTGSGVNKTYISDKTLVSSKANLFDVISMAGLTNSMSDDAVKEKIKKHILDDKKINSIKSSLNIDVLQSLEVPKDDASADYKRVEILNIIRDVDAVVGMRDEICRIYVDETDKTKEVENIQTKSSPDENKIIPKTVKERLKQAVDLYIKKIGRRRYSNYRTITKRELENKRLTKENKSNRPMRPSRVYETSSNSHMDIFETQDGEIDWQCVAKIDALVDDYKPQWKADNPDAKLIFNIKSGDEFIIFDEEKQQEILVFLLKISEGYLVLYPIEVSNTADKIEVGGEKIENPSIIRIQSIGALKKSKLQKIRRNDIGKVTWKSKKIEV